jgi:hypothetical protein
MTQNQPNPPESQQPQNAPPGQRSLAKRLTINVLRGTIQLLERAVEKLEAPPPATPQPSIFDKLRPVWAIIGRGWLTILNAIRSVLPAPLQEKIPNWSLSGALITVLAVSIGSLYLIVAPKPPEVATITPVPIQEPTPPILSAPADSVPVEPLPSPAPNLTPEQALIASIQTQVSEVTGKYSESLIEAIQANFRESILVVTIADEWYTLEEPRQNKLVKDIQQRAKTLDFSRLELIDYQGSLVARSAVIGDEMIILKRRNETLISEQ